MDDYGPWVARQRELVDFNTNRAESIASGSTLECGAELRKVLRKLSGIEKKLAVIESDDASVTIAKRKRAAQRVAKAWAAVQAAMLELLHAAGQLSLF